MANRRAYLETLPTPERRVAIYFLLVRIFSCDATMRPPVQAVEVVRNTLLDLADS